MENQEYPQVTDASGGFMDLVTTYFPFVVLIVLLYFVVKLYIKLSRYLDRKNKQG